MSGTRRSERAQALGVLLAWVMTFVLLGLALEGIFRLAGMRPVVTINETSGAYLSGRIRRNETRYLR